MRCIVDDKEGMLTGQWMAAFTGDMWGTNGVLLKKHWGVAGY